MRLLTPRILSQNSAELNKQNRAKVVAFALSDFIRLNISDWRKQRMSKLLISLFTLCCLCVMPMTGLAQSLGRKTLDSTETKSNGEILFKSIRGNAPSRFTVLREDVGKTVEFEVNGSDLTFNYEGEPNKKTVMVGRLMDKAGVELLDVEESIDKDTGEKRKNILVKVNSSGLKSAGLKNAKYPEIFVKGVFFENEKGDGIYKSTAFLPDGKVLERFTMQIPKAEFEKSLKRIVDGGQSGVLSENSPQTAVEFVRAGYRPSTVALADPLVVIVVIIVTAVVIALGCFAVIGYCNISCNSACTRRGGTIKSLSYGWCGASCTCVCNVPPKKFGDAGYSTEDGIDN